MIINRLNALFFLLVMLLNQSAIGQISLSDYFPNSTNYNKSIPTPASVLGHEVGEWHVSHDKLLFYVKELAKASDRIIIEEYAKSFEDRPLVYLTITSSANQANLTAIQKDHIALSNTQSSNTLAIKEMPAVVYMGYSVHGNESSGANAALLIAYHLAAAQGPEIDDLLKNTIILLDPAMNPDGINRFASWVNSHKSVTPDPNSDSREHREVWPRGRTNHYWFDLNRDWLPVQLPESQGRIKVFHKWKPNILTDHHEMGTNATFFFQPGIPARTNPLTPSKNQELTAKVTTYHAKSLDKVGSLYYSKESFDDFYYGKGSTYPDANGCIGILFEQASSRGHLQSSINGPVSFQFTIQNQLEASLATMAAAKELKEELLTFQRDFYKKGREEARRDPIKGYLVGAGDDEVKLLEFMNMLSLHQIIAYKNEKDIVINGVLYQKDKSYAIPMEQDQYRLIRAMFDNPTTFRDSLFYDVSGWTLPFAFNLDFAKIDRIATGEVYKIGNSNKPKSVVGGLSNYAYLFEWNNYNGPMLLENLLAKGLIAKVSNEPIETGNNNQKFSPGAILIPVSGQSTNKENLFQILNDQANSSGVEIYAVNSGLTANGVDLGSPSFTALRAPKIALLTGSGVNGYDAGEVWHLLDARFNIPVTLLETVRLSSANLSKYNTLVMADGSYGSITANATEKIKAWIRQGGTLIAMRGAVKWAAGKGISYAEYKPVETKKGDARPAAKPYNNINRERGAQYIGGAIFETKIDLRNPLCYGYTDQKLPVFHRGTGFFKLTRNAYATPVRYTEKPLMSGYISRKNMKLLKNSAGIVVNKQGSGSVISFAFNPNFRAFWYGTNPLFTNAIFFGQTLNSGAFEHAPPKKPSN